MNAIDALRATLDDPTLWAYEGTDFKYGKMRLFKDSDGCYGLQGDGSWRGHSYECHVDLTLMLSSDWHLVRLTDGKFVPIEEKQK